MAANPLGAHQIGGNFARPMICRQVADRDVEIEFWTRVVGYGLNISWL
jgi:hypothetical protein